MDESTYKEGALSTENVNYTEIGLTAAEHIRLDHAITGIVTEAGELADALKRVKFYGKDLDITNMKEEAGDLLWYFTILLDELGTDLSEIRDMNNRKLTKKRYKNGFSKEAALNRNTEEERKELEA